MLKAFHAFKILLENSNSKLPEGERQDHKK